MENEKEVKRIFSLGENFMDFHTDDIVYGFMRTLSTARPVDKEKKIYEEYLPMTMLAPEKKMLANWFGCSVRNVNYKIDKLIEKKLVATKIIGNETCYIFPVKADKKNPFRLVNKKILQYLVYTRNNQCIRIYLYLLNKFLWKETLNQKKEEEDEQKYIFTVQEIKEALGYNPNTKTVNKMISAVLASFNKEGIISYETKTDTKEVGGRVIPVKRLQLNYVITNPESLPEE